MLQAHPEWSNSRVGEATKLVGSDFSVLGGLVFQRKMFGELSLIFVVFCCFFFFSFSSDLEKIL